MECKHQHTPPARGFKQHLRRVLCLTRLRSPLQIPRLPCFLLLAMGCVVLQGCSNYTLEWKEEVKLSDGNVIVVERKAHRKPGGFPDSMRGVYFGTELSYAPLGINWQGTFGIARTPISFDRVDGVFYLVQMAENITACTNKKPDAYAIQILKWSNGQWLEIPQTAAPVDRILINLEGSPFGHNKEDDTKGLLRLNGDDGRPYDIHRSGRENRTNPETLQSYYERTALDPRTQKRDEDEELYHWNFHLCGYWHRRVPAVGDVSREEAIKRFKEDKERFDRHLAELREAEQKEQQEAEQQQQPETQLNAPAENP